MKKNEFEEITKTINRMRSEEKISEIIRELKDWDYNHAMKNNSWFWNNNGNSYERDWKEKKYSRNCSLEIGKFNFSFSNSVIIHRKHVYWKDWLTINDSGEPARKIYIHFGDIRKLIEVATNRRAFLTAKDNI